MASRGHVGKAGQLAVMAEFLLRGYNVAMPEVDIGDDIFVVHDLEGQLWRIQVKTAIGKRTQRGHRGKFAVARGQLRTARRPELFYVLALRRGPAWEYAIGSRRELFTEHDTFGAGSVSGDNVIFALHFTETTVICSSRDWQPWRNNWAEWPILDG
jgi:hypothetical protein